MKRGMKVVIAVAIIFLALGLSAKGGVMAGPPETTSPFSSWNNLYWKGGQASYDFTTRNDGTTQFHINGSSDDRIVKVNSSLGLDEVEPGKFYFSIFIKTQIGLSPSGGQDFSQANLLSINHLQWASSYLNVYHQPTNNKDGLGCCPESALGFVETDKWTSVFNGSIYFPGTVIRTYLDYAEYQENVWSGNQQVAVSVGHISLYGSGVMGGAIPEPAGLGICGLAAAMGLVRRPRF